MTVADILAAIDAQAARVPDRFALAETTGRRVTYAELHETVTRVAANLRAAGFRRGDHVFFMVRPRIESIALILAVMRLGGVLVAVDPTAGDALFAARLARVPPRWMIAESSLFALALFGPVRTALRHRGVALPNLRQHIPKDCTAVYVGRWLPGVPRGALAWCGPHPPAPSPSPADRSQREISMAMKRGRGGGKGTLTMLIKDRALSFPPLSIAAPTFKTPRSAGDGEGPGVRNNEDPAVIVFTSGTTDVPKAVVHVGASIGATMAMLTGHFALTRGDVVYASEMHLVLPALMAGALAVLSRGTFHPKRFAEHIARYRVTHTFAVPSDFERVVAHLAARRQRLPAHLRVLLFGAAPAEKSFLERCAGILAPETTAWSVYAMTEMLPVCAATLAEKLAYDGDGDLLGIPFPGVYATVEAGELVLAGPNLFRGYLGEPDVAAHRTGDLARIDDAGRIVLLGRKKEMIIRGHTNIYPALVEGTVNRIAGVRACALVGWYDAARSDERVVLVVEPLDGVDHAVLRVRLERELRAGPHSIDTTAYPDAIVIAPLPRAGRSRKVDRRALAALVAGEC